MAGSGLGYEQVLHTQYEAIEALCAEKKQEVLRQSEAEASAAEHLSQCKDELAKAEAWSEQLEYQLVAARPALEEAESALRENEQIRSELQMRLATAAIDSQIASEAATAIAQKLHADELERLKHKFREELRAQRAHHEEGLQDWGVKRRRLDETILTHEASLKAKDAELDTAREKRRRADDTVRMQEVELSAQDSELSELQARRRREREEILELQQAIERPPLETVPKSELVLRAQRRLLAEARHELRTHAEECSVACQAKDEAATQLRLFRAKTDDELCELRSQALKTEALRAALERECSRRMDCQKSETCSFVHAEELEARLEEALQAAHHSLEVKDEELVKQRRVEQVQLEVKDEELMKQRRVEQLRAEAYADFTQQVTESHDKEIEQLRAALHKKEQRLSESRGKAAEESLLAIKALNAASSAKQEARERVLAGQAAQEQAEASFRQREEAIRQREEEMEELTKRLPRHDQLPASNTSPGVVLTDPYSVADVAEGPYPTQSPDLPPPSLAAVDAALTRLMPSVQPLTSYIAERDTTHTLTKVLENIWFSGTDVLQDMERLREQNFTRIITVCDCKEKIMGMQRLVLDKVDDAPHYPLLRLLKWIKPFVGMLRKGELCLIHCRAGINRSASLALAIWMHQRMKAGERGDRDRITDPEELLRVLWQAVANARGDAVVRNIGFQRQLYMYAHLMVKYGSKCTWPDYWGPELWLPVHASHALSAEDHRKIRITREKLETALQDMGETSFSTIGIAARIVASKVEKQCQILKVG